MDNKELIEAINGLKESIETLTESVRTLSGKQAESIKDNENNHDDNVALRGKITELIKSIAGLRFD